MARKKVKLARIAGDSTRRATYKKRMSGLTKKASSLATLCNVKACMIVYGPQEEPAEALRMAALFESLPDMAKCRRMVDQEGFLRQLTLKLQEQLRRQQRENRELELSLLLLDLLAPVGEGRSVLELGLEDASDVVLAVDVKLKAVRERIKHQTTQLALKPAAADEEVKSPVASLQRENWRVDLKNNPNKENQVFFLGGHGGGGSEDEITGLQNCLDINNNPTRLQDSNDFPFN